MRYLKNDLIFVVLVVAIYLLILLFLYKCFHDSTTVSFLRLCSGNDVNSAHTSDMTNPAWYVQTPPYSLIVDELTVSLGTQLSIFNTL